MPLHEGSEYYIVKGWFEHSNGLHNNQFYGAVATPENLLKPRRVVLAGADAQKASEMAARQPAKVYPSEILEGDTGGLTPAQAQDTQRLILDQDKVQRRKCTKCGGCADRAKGQKCGLPMNGGECDGVMGDVASESVCGTGSIAMNAYKSGMPDRGGFGREKYTTGRGFGKQEPQKGNNSKFGKRIGLRSIKRGTGAKFGLKGIANKMKNLPTVSASGGSLGGRS